MVSFLLSSDALLMRNEQGKGNAVMLHNFVTWSSDPKRTVSEVSNNYTSPSRTDSKLVHALNSRDFLRFRIPSEQDARWNISRRLACTRFKSLSRPLPPPPPSMRDILPTEWFPMRHEVSNATSTRPSTLYAFPTFHVRYI